MALKQSRRSISVRGTTYDKLRQYGETHDRSMSDIVEELLATILDTAQPQPKAAAPAPQPVQREKSEARLRFNPPPVQKPRPTLANRVVRAVAPQPPANPIRPPVPTRQPLPGRPAPTPASQVIKVRREEDIEKDDYRAIRF
jgi:hypothetical protein